MQRILNKMKQFLDVEPTTKGGKPRRLGGWIRW
jgi:hypothetical protein